METQAVNLRTTTTLPFEAAEQQLRQTLTDAGFSVLVEFDLSERLREKLGVELGRYLVLGACNPALAYEAVQIWPDVGVLLPCNVLLHDVGDHRVVAAFNPLAIEQVRQNPRLFPIARQLRERLEQVLQSVEHASSAA
jgi:uncharacterized protein (DUF302 family)